MRISKRQFARVSVETQSGDTLGKLSDFDLETDTGEIVTYHVKTAQGIAGLLSETLLVSKDQVISFDKKKMVVQDSLVKSTAGKTLIPSSSVLDNPSPIINSKS